MPIGCHCKDSGGIMFRGSPTILTSDSCMTLNLNESRWATKKYTNVECRVNPVEVNENGHILACSEKNGRYFTHAYDFQQNLWDYGGIDVTKCFDPYYFFLCHC